MINITNDFQLREQIKMAAEIAINNVSDKILQLLKRNIVYYVYFLDYMPNKYYYNGSGTPTWEFLNAFKWEPIKNNLTNVTRLLFYDFLSMRADPNTYLHADPVNGDNREMLAQYLDVEGYDNGILGGKLRGAYWKNTFDELLSGTLDGWFKEEFEALGFIRT